MLIPCSVSFDVCFKFYNLANKMFTISNAESIEAHINTDSIEAHINTESIEAHIKKGHSENISFDICDFETKDIDVLETHIAACQIYKGCCKEIFKNIPDIKKHVNSKHGGGRWLIKHICIDPKNSEYLVSETHYSDQLFRKYKK